MGTGNISSTSRYWLCPLYSFSCYSKYSKTEDFDYPPESVDLAEGIQIRRIVPEFTRYIVKRHPDWKEAIVAEYMVVLPYSVAVNNEMVSLLTEIIDKSNLLVDLVTAFRLCHAGVVVPGPLVFAQLQKSGVLKFEWRSVSPAFREIFLDISKTEIDFSLIGLPEYEFYLSDIPMVNKLMMEIRTCRESGKSSTLNEALRRFNSAYHGELEDRLIDQMIAFESLYIADYKELGYKLALRTAFLLGKKRTKIFNDMRKAYDLRGNVVHGSKQVKDYKLGEIIPKTEEYLRQSIRRFLLLLLQGHSLKQIREHLLDENILKNSKILAIRE